jgi:uncharacterized protein
MPTDSVFIDTAALLAIANADDALHESTVTVYGELSRARTPLVTTQWVLAEFLNGASRPLLRVPAVSLVRALLSSKRVSVLAATTGSWDDGLALFATRPDKEWSFIDCISIHVCKEAGIQRVLTRDRHFAQAGFIALLG